MNVYIVTGTCRQVGAIGIFEPFARVVKADDPEAAKERARTILYSEGYEHIHIHDAEYHHEAYPAS